MTIYKVAELEGVNLDLAVAIAEGWKRNGDWWSHVNKEEPMTGMVVRGGELFPAPWSSSWMWGGPIIERERIALSPPSLASPDGDWFAETPSQEADLDGGALGPTALIAAMRAYVASKFGEEVDLPC